MWLTIAPGPTRPVHLIAEARSLEGNLHNRRAFGPRVGCSSWHRATASRRENDNVADRASIRSQVRPGRSLPLPDVVLAPGGGRKAILQICSQPLARGGAQRILVKKALDVSRSRAKPEAGIGKREAGRARRGRPYESLKPAPSKDIDFASPTPGSWDMPSLTHTPSTNDFDLEASRRRYPTCITLQGLQTEEECRPGAEGEKVA